MNSSPLRSLALLHAVLAVALLSTTTARAQDTAMDCTPVPGGGTAFLCTPRATGTTPAPSPVSAIVTPPPLTKEAPVERSRLVEVLGGVLGELVALVPAIGLGALIDIGDTGSDEGNGVPPPAMAAFVSYTVISPFAVAAGVTLSSKENLSSAQALLGAAIGTLPGAVLLFAGLTSVNDESDGSVAGVFAIAASLGTLIAAPIVSMAMAGPSEDKEERRERAQSPRIAPTASLFSDGTGGTVGLTGRF